MIFNNNIGLSYDDMLLVPKFSEIEHRNSINVSGKFSKNVKLNIPLVSANMSTVTDGNMAVEMSKLGGLGIIHRNHELSNLKNRFGEVAKAKRELFDNLLLEPDIVGVSIGLNDDLDDIIKILRLKHSHSLPDVLVLDVAHAHQKQVLKYTRDIIDKGIQKYADLVVGNVCTPEAVYNFCKLGVDGIKVGVGPGSCCTTRIVTGCGVPQLSAIMECANACDPEIPICADGGIRNSGDIVKALAAGASTVMIGRLFAFCKESAGWETKTFTSEGDELFGIPNPLPYYRIVDWKKYRGSSTFGIRTPEGIQVDMTEQTNLVDVLVELCDGIRSGMSYNGAINIKQLQSNAEFRMVSNHSFNESNPRH